jgi:hypothetical protein
MKKEPKEHQDRHQDEPPPCPQLILLVKRGIVEALFKPVGLDLTLFDYDVEGVGEGLSRDVDGRDCLIRLWPANQKVVENRHWPMIRRALRAARRAGARTWRCEDCDRTVRLTYEELAEAGNPLCPGCEEEMALL